MCWLCGVSSVCQWQLLCVCWADWMLVEAGTSCCSASTEDGDPAAASHSPLPTLAGAGHQPRLHLTLHQHPYTAKHCKQCSQIMWIFSHLNHGEIIYGGTRWIEDDCYATFSEYIFLFPACLMISHWLTKNAELNSVF